MTARTFEDWWVMRAQTGTEDKLLARDAWFAAAAVYNHDHQQVLDRYSAMEAALKRIQSGVGLARNAAGIEALKMIDELLGFDK